MIGYPAFVAFQIWQQSHEDEMHAADAIVVMGAAQYNGTPSPVLKARLDHATYLYEQGLSDTVIVTGGKAPGDVFTEAQAGQAYLESAGISSEHILAENEGRTTLESLRNVKALTRSRGIDSVLLVSDPLHSERVKTMAHDLGFEEAYASPGSYLQLDRSRWQKAKELVRETGALIVYRLLNR